jgi:hypothetical protein
MGKRENQSIRVRTENKRWYDFRVRFANSQGGIELGKCVRSYSIGRFREAFSDLQNLGHFHLIHSRLRAVSRNLGPLCDVLNEAPSILKFSKK